jgi:hypothetical protein
MLMRTKPTVLKMKIWHKGYNPGKKDNLQHVPSQKAVFGIFGIVGDLPVNCRFVGETENLQAEIRDLFEHSAGHGLKIFMQGPWIHMLQYSLMPASSTEERTREADAWKQQYEPRVDTDGEYPGYY